jgi:signal transduction histidine kinase
MSCPRPLYLRWHGEPTLADILLRVADPAIGILLGGCGGLLIARRRRSLVGPLMLLSCACWFAGSLWSLAVFLHRGPLVHLHISYPTGRIRRPLAIATVVCAYAVSTVEAVARNPWVTLGTAVLVACAAADIYARTSGTARKAGRPALAAACTFASALSLSAANQLLVWERDRLVLLVYDVAICTVAILLAADLLWGRWTEATVADFVTQLGARPDAGTLSLAVQRALGDPTVVIGFWLPDQRRYVDDRGAPFEPPPNNRPDRSAIKVDDAGQPAALLVHDAATSYDQQLITDVTTALRIALGNARLQAQVRANVVELARARRRLVEAADAQRRQLEADLASGPQRGLSETARWFEQALATSDPDLRSRLRTAQAEVVRAKVELQELAIGIRPPVLESGGLVAALPHLIAHARPTEIHLNVAATRLPPAVEGAVYFVCAEALVNIAKHARASTASVDVTVEQGVVVARIVDFGRGGADPRGSGLRGLRDRVEALDGTFTVNDHTGGGTAIDARIPLEEPQ